MARRKLEPGDVAAVIAAADPAGADGYLESRSPSLHLAPEHYRDLKKSGLDSATIDLMKVKSIRPADISKIINNPAVESLLEFPYPTFDGDLPFSRYKIFPPLVDADGHKRKYHQASDSGCHLYFLDPARKTFTDPRIPLCVIEGEKKMAKGFQHGLNVVALGGVWNWCVSETGELIKDFDNIALVDRAVELVFDSPTWVRDDQQRAVYAFGKSLEARGAKVSVVVIPGAPDGASVGFDDFVVANGFGEFKKLARVTLKHPALAQHKVWHENRQKHKTEKVDDLPGHPIVLANPEPWPTPVDGDRLLHEISAALTRFVVLPEHAETVLAVWVLHAHALDSFNISPVLEINSPVPECGKTVTLSLLRTLVPRPLGTANISPSALFRVTDKVQPTLLIDEGDTFVKLSEELRGILNASHVKSEAFIVRTEGDRKREPRTYSTWCAKAVALIGSLPSTLRSRSITIQMERKTQDEHVEQFRLHHPYTELENLRSQAWRWARDNLKLIQDCDPDSGFTNRLHDNWDPLVRIAESRRSMAGALPERLACLL